MAGCVTDDRQLALLWDNSLCHGWAGLVLTVWRAAADAERGGELAAALPRLRTHLEHRLHPHGPPADGGLLEGEAGMRLVGHTIDTVQPERTHWDLCLLLSGWPHLTCTIRTTELDPVERTPTVWGQ